MSANENHINEWMSMFSELRELDEGEQSHLKSVVSFKRLNSGDIAYQPGWECGNYLMCLSGKTRVYKSSESGREILLYRVGQGETCVLTTSCLMADTHFPAESIAEQDTLLAAIPASDFHALMSQSEKFRKFVHANYSDLLSTLILLVNEVAFSRVDTRLARYLLRQSDEDGILQITHQQLALDMGSVREVVSRHLSDWERRGWIQNERGKIILINREELSKYAELND